MLNISRKYQCGYNFDLKISYSEQSKAFQASFKKEREIKKGGKKKT